MRELKKLLRELERVCNSTDVDSEAGQVILDKIRALDELDDFQFMAIFNGLYLRVLYARVAELWEYVNELMRATREREEAE
jgi:hypothetical protein